jgi:hypothetical protein
LLDTLKALFEIESGTFDIEGVTRTGAVIAERLRALVLAEGDAKRVVEGLKTRSLEVAKTESLSREHGEEKPNAERFWTGSA